MENLKNTVETNEVIAPVMTEVQTTQTELSPDDQILKINNDIETNKNDITNLSTSTEKTKLEINEIYRELGLPTTEQDPPSVLHNKSEIEDLIAKQKLLEEQKNEILRQKESTVSPVESEIIKEKNDDSEEKENSSSEKKNVEISEGLLEKLSESIQVKKNLELRVFGLKNSPAFKEFEEKSKGLNEKRKRLEGLKIPDNFSSGSSSMNIDGSISMNGSVSFNGEIGGKPESNDSGHLEFSQEKEIIDLEREAENLLKRTEFEILKLQKEEIEFGSEGMSIKNGELDIESRKVDAELDIWSDSDMNQKTFDEIMQKLRSPEGVSADIKDKEKFLRFRDVENEAQVYRDKNEGFYKTIKNMQGEIDQKELILLDCPNESKILEILNTYEKVEEDTNKVTETEEIEPKPEEEISNELESTENNIEIGVANIDTKENETKEETPNSSA